MDKETLRMNLETELKRGVQTLAVLSLLKDKAIWLLLARSTGA